MKMIRKLNTLRGLAVFLVLLEHYSNSTSLWGRRLGDGAGQIGVMLFFILSGFLMSYLYLEKSFTPGEIKNFMVARVARVIPLYCLVVLISFLMHQIPAGTNWAYAITDLKDLLAHLFILSGTSVMWTIPSEVRFYFLFIGLWYLYAKKPGWANMAMGFVFTLMILFNFPIKRDFHVFGLLTQVLIFGCLQYFFAGVLLGQVYTRKMVPENYKHHGFILVLVFIPLLFPHIFSGIFNRPFNPDAALLWKDVGLFFVVAMIFFTLVFLVPDDNRLLTNRTGDFLGKISYSLYLLHVPVLLSMEPYLRKNPIPGLFLFIFSAVIISWFSFEAFENPARKIIRRRWRQSLETINRADIGRIYEK